MDKIFLRELRIETIIGFWEWERRIKQIVSIDLEIGTDARIAAASDGIAGTLELRAAREAAHRVRRRARSIRWSKALATAIGAHRGPRVRRAVGQGVGREARRDSGRARGRHRHRAHAGRLCLRCSSGPAAMPIPNDALRRALAELERRFGALRCSSVYRGAAVGGPAADYLNLVVGCSSRTLAVDSLRARAARDRGARGPRARADPAVCELDLDLLLYGARVDAERRLPRPGLFRLPFVLGRSPSSRRSSCIP